MRDENKFKQQKDAGDVVDGMGMDETMQQLKGLMREPDYPPNDYKDFMASVLGHYTLQGFVTVKQRAAVKMHLKINWEYWY